MIEGGYMNLKNLTKKGIIILLVIFILIFLIGCMPQLPDNLKKLKNNPIIKKELEFCPAFQACQFYRREIKDD